MFVDGNSAKRCSTAHCLVVVLLAVACEHALGTALRRAGSDEMVPVGQAVGDESIEETVHQTGNLAPQFAGAPQMISPAEEEEAEEGEEEEEQPEEVPASPPAVAYPQVQEPVTDAGGPVPVAASPGAFADDKPAPMPAVQVPMAPEVRAPLALPAVSLAPAAPVNEATVVSDHAQPALPTDALAPEAPVAEATLVSDDDGAQPVVDGDANDGADEVAVVDDAGGSAKPVASMSPLHREPSRPVPQRASGKDAHTDLLLASRYQKAHHVHAKQGDEPEEDGEEESGGEGGEGGGDDEGGDETPSNASQIVLDPNVKEYTICDPPCITGRGMCNDQVCFCKGSYYGSTCQHQMREDEWLQLAPPVVGVLCLVAAAAGIALAQIIFNGLQAGRKAIQEHQFGPPSVRKECWQPSDSSASKKGKK